MFSPLFWFFAALTLICGIAVVANRNPVASALSLVISFMGLAALFVGLDAYLIAVLQVLVYAGAVMVLFLFIIMLLDLRAEQRRRFNWLGLGGGGLVTLGFIAELLFVLSHYSAGRRPFPPLIAPIKVEFEGFVASGPIDSAAPVPLTNVLLPSTETTSISPVAATPAPKVIKETLFIPNTFPNAKSAQVDDVREIGREIFTNYNFPLQVVGILLLVSTVGVIILSRKELK